MLENCCLKSAEDMIFSMALLKRSTTAGGVPAGTITPTHAPKSKPAKPGTPVALAKGVTPGSPWENGYCESFNGKFRDQWLNGELFYSLGEARVLIEQWRIHFNTLRPHQSIGKRPPAPGTWLPKTKAEKDLHLSLFPAIPTPQEVHQRLSLQ